MSEKKSAKNQATATKKPGKGQPEGFHPAEHMINVVMSDGSKLQIMTSWGKEGDTLYLDVDPKNHPAWQEKSKNFVNSSDERVANFKKKYGDL